MVRTEPTVITAFDVLKMGTNGASQFIMSSAIEMMEKAKAFFSPESGGEMTVPPFVPPLEAGTFKSLIKTAKTVHDQKLDQVCPKHYCVLFRAESKTHGIIRNMSFIWILRSMSHVYQDFYNEACVLGQVLFPKWTFLPFNISLLP